MPRARRLRRRGLERVGRVERYLRVLRDHGFANVRPEGSRRLYSVEARALSEVHAWRERFKHFWDQPLDALDTEIARGKRARRRGGDEDV